MSFFFVCVFYVTKPIGYQENDSQITYAYADRETYDSIVMQQYDEFHAGYINENTQVHNI